MTPLHVKCIKLLGQVATIETLAFDISFKCHILSFEGRFQLCLWQQNKCWDILQLRWWRRKLVSQNMIQKFTCLNLPDIDHGQQCHIIKLMDKH